MSVLLWVTLLALVFFIKTETSNLTVYLDALQTQLLFFCCLSDRAAAQAVFGAPSGQDKCHFEQKCGTCISKRHLQLAFLVP